MPTRDEGDRPVDASGMDAIRQAMMSLGQGKSPGAPTQQEPFRPRHPDLESWVHGFFVLTFGRAGGQVHWCARWWDHPEAVLRLDALWRTWEAAMLDPVKGAASWIRNHLDPNLAVLFSASGPFGNCPADQHVPQEPLPVTPPPDTWFTSEVKWWDLLAEEDR